MYSRSGVLSTLLNQLFTDMLLLESLECQGTQSLLGDALLM